MSEVYQEYKNKTKEEIHKGCQNCEDKVEIHLIANPLGGHPLFYFLSEGEISIKVSKEFADLFPFTQTSEEFWLASRDRRMKKWMDRSDLFIEGNFRFPYRFYPSNFPTSTLEADLDYVDYSCTTELFLSDPRVKDIREIFNTDLAFKWDPMQVEPYKIITLEPYDAEHLLLCFPKSTNPEENGAEHVFLIQLKRFLKNEFDFNMNIKK
jgi:hypothetical protein